MEDSSLLYNVDRHNPRKKPSTRNISSTVVSATTSRQKPSTRTRRDYHGLGEDLSSMKTKMRADSAPFIPRSKPKKPSRRQKTKVYKKKKSPSPQNNINKKNQLLSCKKKRDKFKFLGVVGGKDDHTHLSAEKIELLTRGTYECIICMEPIKRQEQIWHHTKCFGIFHFKCTLKWSTQPLPEGSKDTQWRCPFCNTGVSSSTPESWCFCMKIKNPEFNPYITPHSCGEPCGRIRNDTPCPHPCILPCHPGSCPPCVRDSPIYHCFCGKIDYTLRCSDINNGKSCGNVCSKLLSCGRHHCKDICHVGDCKPCEITMEQICYCGTIVEERVCGTDNPDISQGEEERHFSCEDNCERPYECGNHVCEQICHPGDCGECPLLPENVKTCACGKHPAEDVSSPRTSCLQPIPTCGNTCNKLLHCGVHRCTLKCHDGPCPSCSGNIRIPCRCGSSKKRFPCKQVHPPPWDPPCPKDLFTCKQVCRELRSCGRHQCGVKCCPASKDPSDSDGFHVCSLKCPKTLNCGKHKCEMLCHRGKCMPCPHASYDEVTCACGRTVMMPPIPCGTPPPDCPHPCIRPSTCKHPIGTHRCHMDGRCPPCVILVKRECMGGHKMMDRVPCHLRDVSCGGKCNKLLPCGQHHCDKSCHRGECCEGIVEEEYKGRRHVSCGKPCNMPLLTCEHSCTSQCHPGSSCPTPLCTQMTTIHCACKRRSQKVVCMRGVLDGVLVEPKERVLECDDECKHEERQRRLREAFGVDGPLGRIPSYGEELMELALNRPKLLYRVEKIFKELIEGSNRTYSFPPMKSDQRQIVHELAEFYNIETRSYDFEPRRSVTATKRSTSRLPVQLLSDHLKDKHARQHRSQYLVLGSASRTGSSTGRPTYTSRAARSLDIKSSSTNRRTFVLHIYDLTAEVKTKDLIDFLSPFAGKFTIKWIDEENALAIFNKPPEPETVLAALQPPPGKDSNGSIYYKVKLSEEHNSTAPPPWLVERRMKREAERKLKQNKKESNKSFVLATFEEDDDWRETVNPFSVLEEGQDTENLTNTDTTVDIQTPSLEESSSTEYKHKSTSTQTKLEEPPDDWTLRLSGEQIKSIDTNDDGKDEIDREDAIDGEDPM